MSLASRLVNTFFPDQTSRFTSEGNINTRREPHNGNHRNNVQQFPMHKELLPVMEEDETEGRPPYLHAMLAGGIGGTSGDMLMHSLDTVKTRQQGDPHMPPRYTTMSSTFSTIFRQEGVARGLYGGVTPALLGSFPGTVLFFGAYEWSKRYLIDHGVAPSISYLTAGFFADLVASIVYVPSEVLKTRLQLQGRYNNPFFHSGYNYRSTLDATRTIVRTEGLGALFYGYRATLWRDLPYSALQFAFYEEERELAMRWVGNRDIGSGLEIFTATTAGAMAGTLTCPLDVVKTRLQTQRNPAIDRVSLCTSAEIPAQPYAMKHSTSPSPVKPHNDGTSNAPQGSSTRQAHRYISTTPSPNTTVSKSVNSTTLQTSSMITGLHVIYKTEGIAGWFRGVWPRAVWTGLQTGVMFVCYQALLRKLEQWDFVDLPAP